MAEIRIDDDKDSKTFAFVFLIKWLEFDLGNESCRSGIAS